MPDNFFTYIGNAILSLFTAHADLFTSTGFSVFKLSDALVLALFGAETVLPNHFVFIPSLLWPGLEWIFWGWLKSFYSYALYQIVASVMVYIIANVMVKYFDVNPGPYTLENIQTNIIELAVICGLSIYSIFKVPSLAGSIGRGSGGESIVRDNF